MKQRNTRVISMTPWELAIALSVSGVIKGEYCSASVIVLPDTDSNKGRTIEITICQPEMDIDISTILNKE